MSKKQVKDRVESNSKKPFNWETEVQNRKCLKQRNMLADKMERKKQNKAYGLKRRKNGHP